MTVIVYGDFASPDCYLASRRADALAASGTSIDWRAVEPVPGLPVSGRPFSASDQDATTVRFRMLDGLLLPGETLPWTMPRVRPKIEAAVSGYAEAHGTNVDAEVRRLIFELYWRDGKDIGNPNVLRTPIAGPMLRADAQADPLRQAGYAVSVDRGPITTVAYRRIRVWRAQWHALGSPTLPLVLLDGATLSGVDALRRLGKEIIYADADVSPDLRDPRRYLTVDGKPSATWVSQVGGRWRNLYRP